MGNKKNGNRGALSPCQNVQRKECRSETRASRPQVVVASFEAFFVDRIVRRPRAERLGELDLRTLQVFREFGYDATAEISVVDQGDRIQERSQPALVVSQAEDLFKPVELDVEKELGNFLL